MKKGIALVAPLLIAIALLASACNKNSQPATDSGTTAKTTEKKKDATAETDEAPVDYSNYGYVACRVYDESSQGCGFMLGVKNGKKMYVENFPDRFKSHGLVCYVKYIESTERPAGCTIGKAVKIIDIQLKAPDGSERTR